MTGRRRIGVDFGGVITQLFRSGANPANADTMFGQDYLKTPEVPGAIDGLALLARTWAVHIVSKASPRVEARSREWLRSHDLVERTGITADRWHFCRQRSEKAGLARELELDVFVDDRVDVLASLEVGFRVGFGVSVPRPSDAEAYVDTWQELLELLHSCPAGA